MKREIIFLYLKAIGNYVNLYEFWINVKHFNHMNK